MAYSTAEFRNKEAENVVSNGKRKELHGYVMTEARELSFFAILKTYTVDSALSDDVNDANQSKCGCA